MTWWNAADPLELVTSSYDLLVMSEWPGDWDLLAFLVRFWRRVDRSEGCWDWMGSRDSHGYGRLNVEALHLDGVRSTTAPKIMLVVTTGDLPPWDARSERRMDACHTCDRPPCVRPEHLFYGTRAENMRDMWSKGRGRGAVRTYSDEAIEQIRTLVASGLPQWRVAQEVGCSQAHVSNVVNGKYRREGGDAL